MRFLIAALALACAATVHAQSWPSKPIKYIVNFAPGGITPEERATKLREDIPRLGKIVRDSGARVD